MQWSVEKVYNSVLYQTINSKRTLREYVNFTYKVNNIIYLKFVEKIFFRMVIFKLTIFNKAIKLCKNIVFHLNIYLIFKLDNSKI